MTDAKTRSATLRAINKRDFAAALASDKAEHKAETKSYVLPGIIATLSLPGTYGLSVRAFEDGDLVLRSEGVDDPIVISREQATRLHAFIGGVLSSTAKPAAEG